jgi:lactate dehydrogenase-like 2-hydroxyacid dehydrogenase
MPNTVITPHIGYVSRDNLEQMYKTAVDNIRAWMAGKPQNVVLAE